MKTLLRFLVTTLGGLFLASSALAQSPKIDCAGITVTQSGGTFTISGKVSGLGSGSTVNVTVNGVITGEVFCVNKNGTKTSAGAQGTGTAAGSASYTAARNGSVSFSVKISSPPSLETYLATLGGCPKGQSRQVVYALQSYGVQATVNSSTGTITLSCP